MAQKKLKTDVIYHWISIDADDELFYFSPDGEGRIFFDTLKEAQEDTGISKVFRTHRLEEF
jgi:DNA topoisomerase IB